MLRAQALHARASRLTGKQAPRSPQSKASTFCALAVHTCPHACVPGLRSRSGHQGSARRHTHDMRGTSGTVPVPALLQFHSLLLFHNSAPIPQLCSYLTTLLLFHSLLLFQNFAPTPQPTPIPQLCSYSTTPLLFHSSAPISRPAPVP